MGRPPHFLVVIDPSDMNSLSSDMLTFKNITENELSGSMFYHEEIYIFLPDMRSLSHDSSIGLLEFLGFPKGLFGSILVTFGCLLGPLWDPLGTLWVSIGSLWVPFGSLWGHFGGPWPPLGPILVTLASFWGPLTAERTQKVMKRGVGKLFL